MAKLLRSFLLGVAAVAAIPESRADVSYLPVTDSYQLDYQSVYIIVAKDYDVMTSKSIKKTTKYGLSEVKITRSEDGSIVVPGEAEEHTASRFILRDTENEEYPWEIKSEKTNPLVTNANCDLFFRNEYTTTTQINEELIKINVDGSVDILFDGSAKYYIRYYEGNNWFRCAKKSEYSPIMLYRQDDFAFKVDEANTSKDEIRLTSAWEPQTGFLNWPLVVKYIFNDGTDVTHKQLMDEGLSVTTKDGLNISIPRGDGGDVLWVLGVYEPRYFDNDDAMDLGNEFFRYSNIFKFDVPMPENKVTGPEHFTQPKSDGYTFMEQVEFVKDSDVKIYYTIDGSDPIILAEGDAPAYDADITPIIYYGDVIELKFVAVKEGYEPSEIIKLTISGDPKPVTSEGVHFKAPKNDGYEIGDAIVFERDSDVKIYYTLDGATPVIPEAGQVEPEEPGSENHDGKTYDLDVRPLYFEGSSINMVYLAIKQHYAPSEVYNFAIKMNTSNIEDIESDENLPTVYYNIQGTQVKPPLRPGLYIVRKGEEASKIIVR